ncbi:MAG: helicase-associated domain-containing protein [Planctomycetota bacterium]
MRLEEFLNERSIANLQSLQWFWAPATRRSGSKSTLLRLLRQEMLSPDRVRASFEALEPVQQEFLRGLLRLEGYAGDAEFLLRRLPGGTPGPQAVREMLEHLSYRGFLRYLALGRWENGEGFRVEMPQELADTLAEALNIDTREPGLMLSLAHYLAELDERQRRDLAARHGLGESNLHQALAEPEGIERRLDALAEPVQQAARIALDGHGGVLPLDRFPSEGLDIEDVDGPAWRTALEEAALGTYGELSLLELGVGDDHECLVLYHEIVEAWAAAQARDDLTVDHTYACGVDFLTDLLVTVDFVRVQPSKLTSAGRFFKGARNQLSPITALHSTFFADEEALLTFTLTVARELGLVELRPDDRLHATGGSAAWQARPLAEQARAVLEVMLALGATAVPRPHFQGLAAAAKQTVLGLEPGPWVPTRAFLSQVVARYVGALLDRGALTPQEACEAELLPWGPPRAPRTLGGMAEAAREPLLRALNYAGLLDIGRCGDRTFVRASDLVPAILGESELPEPGALLLVNPDFEVVLFPEPGHRVLLHRLCAFCDREKNEVTRHLRLSRDSVQRAVLRGLDADTIVATLRDHGRVPLAQNIEYSIRTWAEDIHPAEVETLHILELPSAQVADAALQLPEVAPLVARRLSPTALALTQPHLPPAAEDALKQLGIHLM